MNQEWKNMKCPKCGFNNADQNTECLKCEIIFEKFPNSQKTDSFAYYSVTLSGKKPNV